MAQFGYPTSDITVGSWTNVGGGATHWGNLDEVSYSDTDYIQANNLTANACEVRVNTLTDPVSSVNHIVHLRVQKAGSGTITLSVDLVENTTVRATRSITLTTSWADVSFTLTGAEADAITNYTNLRIRFTATCAASTRYVRISWANLEVPNVTLNNYVLQTTTGVFTWTRNDAILTYIEKFVLKTTTGVFIWTRNDAILTLAGGLNNYVLQTTTGNFAWTRNDAKLLRSYKIFTSLGAFNLVGLDARLLANRQIRTTAGAFAWNRQNGFLLYNRLIKTVTGSFAWTGNNSIELYNRLIRTMPGQFVWTGLDAILTWGGGLTQYILKTLTGEFNFTGTGKLLANRLTRTTTGIFVIENPGEKLLYNRRILTIPGQLIFSGQDAILTWVQFYKLLTQTGEFNLSSLGAILTWSGFIEALGTILVRDRMGHKATGSDSLHMTATGSDHGE